MTVKTTNQCIVLPHENLLNKKYVVLTKWGILLLVIKQILIDKGSVT